MLLVGLVVWYQCVVLGPSLEGIGTGRGGEGRRPSKLLASIYFECCVVYRSMEENEIKTG